MGLAPNAVFFYLHCKQETVADPLFLAAFFSVSVACVSQSLRPRLVPVLLSEYIFTCRASCISNRNFLESRACVGTVFRVKNLTWGIKGVGAQGDGSVQLLARGREEQEELTRVLEEKGEQIENMRAVAENMIAHSN